MFFDPAYPSLKNGLVGYWSPVATGPTGLQLLDLSGQNNHGTLTNMDAPTDWVDSPYGTALDFDGLSDVNNRDFVSLGNPIGLNKVQTGLSVFLWIKPTSVSGTRTIWAAYKSTTNSELYSMIRLEGTTLKYYASNAVGGFQSVGTLTITNNVWSLVGFTVSGTIASPVSTTFVNLASQANNLSALSATPADGVDFRIGAPQSAASSEAFQGQVAEACAWSRVLTLTENRELYRLGPGKLLRSKPTGGPSKRKWWPGVKTPKPRPIIPTQRGIKSGPVFYDPKAAWFKNGLVGHWCPSLTGATGTQLLDLSGQNNNGVLTNMDVPTDWVDSPYGTVLDFDGVNDHVATSAWRGLAGDYSASFWFRTSFATSGAVALLSSSFNGAGGVHVMGIRGTDGALYAFAGTERFFGNGYNNNSWVLATITRRFSDGSGTMYANGLQAGTSGSIGTNDPGGGTGWRFGGTPVFGSQFPGQIAGVFFHGRLLTHSEHQQLYQAGPGGFASRVPKRRASSYSPAPKKIFKSRIDRKRSVSLVHPDHDHEWVTNGLVGFWCPSLTSPTGTQLLDLSGQNNNGTLTNMDAPTDWVDSPYGTVLDFDGSNDYIPLTPSNLKTYCPSVGCVMIWVYPRSHSRNAYLADWNVSGANETFRIEMSGFGISTNRVGGTFLASGDATAVETSAQVNLNIWHCISIQRTPIGQELYWNGVLDASNSTAATTNPAAANPIVLGRGGSFNGLYSNMQVSGVSLWNRPLTPSEHQQLYQLGPRMGFSRRPSRSPTWMVEADETIGNRRRRIICGGKN